MIKFFSLLLFTFVYTNTNAHCIKGNCINGNGTKVSAKGDRWEGRFVNAKLNGNGVWKSNHGDHFQGQFKNGKMHGKGRLKLRNGDIYIGEFQKGLFHGTGRYKYKNGDTYFGGWYKGNFNGKGRYTFATGKVIEGQFENGAPVTTYVVNNQESQKIKTETSTTTLEMNTSDSPKDCTRLYCDNEKGVYNYSDGSRYIGEFKKGAPHGIGRCEYSNGDVYEGEWKYHTPHGKGIMHFASGKKYAAVWDHGRPQEQLIEEHDYTQAKADYNPTFNERVDIYALVVGVARYNHMPSLKYTDDDAYQVYAHLKSPEGGAVPESNIKVLIDDDATKTNILLAMEQLFSKADENDMVMLYLSGHGLEGSFIPSDFDGYSKNIPYTEIIDIIDRSKAKSKICIADACHSGSLVAMRSPYQASLDGYYTELEKSRGGTALMMSSAAEEKSLEYSGLRQGVFSHFLLKGMKGDADQNNDKIINITELFRYVTRGVDNYTGRQQTPILTGTYDPLMPVAMVR